MQSYEFVVVLGDEPVATAGLADRLYEAGCDDATLYSSQGEAAVGFDREAESLEAAIRTAIRDVTAAGVQAVRVESVDGPIYSQINQELTSNT